MSDRYTFPDEPRIAIGYSVAPPATQRYFLHASLFLLTVLTTLFWGSYMMVLHETSVAAPGPIGFLTQVISNPALLYKGIGYSFAIMLILLCHEMGHYLACCYYGINATLPFFLPAPIVWTGTFGAFIRIRAPFPNRRSLFDVGIAGPLAGFFVSLPFIYLGIRLSPLVEKTASATGQIYLGDPLIFKLFSPDSTQDYMLHPVGFAAWFACLATSLNLIPIAQLDGGHISYALFRKKAYKITWIFFGGLLALAAYGFTRSPMAGFQWVFFSIMILVLKKIAGFRHPPTLNDDEPIGTARVIWGIIAAIVFILTFIPVTIFS
jgi:membrane-associated protease RseP (regulator of RpoE activity)